MTGRPQNGYTPHENSATHGGEVKVIFKRFLKRVGFKTRSFRSGFTLVELLSIIAIIAILMGITIPVLRSANARAKTSKAKGDIAKLEGGIEQYKNDYGNYPDSGDSKNLYRAVSSISPVTKKAYIIFKSKDIRNETVIDSWGMPYKYTAPGINHPSGTDNTKSVDIYSFGPNKTDDAGSGDDINNWSR